MPPESFISSPATLPTISVTRHSQRTGTFDRELSPLVPIGAQDTPTFSASSDALSEPVDAYNRRIVYSPQTSSYGYSAESTSNGMRLCLFSILPLSKPLSVIALYPVFKKFFSSLFLPFFCFLQDFVGGRMTATIANAVVIETGTGIHETGKHEIEIETTITVIGTETASGRERGTEIGIVIMRAETETENENENESGNETGTVIVTVIVTVMHIDQVGHTRRMMVHHHQAIVIAARIRCLTSAHGTIRRRTIGLTPLRRHHPLRLALGLILIPLHHRHRHNTFRPTLCPTRRPSTNHLMYRLPSEPFALHLTPTSHHLHLLMTEAM